jgi:heat shock protein HslJ
MKGYINSALLAIAVACAPSAKMKSIVQQASLPNRHMQQELEMLHEGVDFVAFANDSSWSLKVDFEKDIIFKLNSATALSTPVPIPEKTASGKTLRYTAATTDQELIVEIQTAACKNDITGLEAPYSVVIQTRKPTDKAYTEFKGCGHDLVDFGLHDIWALRELNGRKITGNDYTREVPRMELNTKDGKILGNTGCNNFFGSLLTRGDKITFSDLGSTKMFCQKSVETEFFKTLGDAERFEIKDLHLLLYNESTLIARFQKVD